jgi:hypothetical protein
MYVSEQYWLIVSASFVELYRPKNVKAFGEEM